MASSAMNSGHIGSDGERSCVEAARRLLGANLSAFLLTGIGEALHPLSRIFIAQSNVLGEELTYRFEMVSNSDLGLPAGKDPLVLAALLSMLAAKDDYDDTIVFHDSLIREMLAWPNSPESRMAIERALEQYCLVGYYRHYVDKSQQGSSRERYYYYRRLLAGYEIDYERSLGLPSIEHITSIRVQFTSGFLRDISSKHKFFLGIDFENLEGIQESAQESYTKNR